MKAILLATALAISATTPRAADEAIEFAQDTPVAFHVTAGEPLTLEPRLARGTGVSFQWYRLPANVSPDGPPPSQTNEIPRATNLVFHIETAIETDQRAYLLRAINSVSDVTTLINAYVRSTPDYSGSFLGGWEGDRGDSYQLFLRPVDQPVEQWYKDGAPIPPPSPTGILNEQTEGAYWFTVTNDLGARFVSRPAISRATPITEVAAKFRHVIEPPSTEGGLGGPPAERMNRDGSVNLYTRRAAYRWLKGTLTKALDLSGSPAGLPPDEWLTRRIYLSEDAAFADMHVYGAGTAAIVRRDAAGFKTIATQGMLINTIPPMESTEITGLVHAAGKCAFWANAGPQTNKLLSLKVFDGVQTAEWFNTRTGMPEGFHDYDTFVEDAHVRASLAFDGETAAFVAYDNFSRRSALFIVTANGGVKVAAQTGDHIAGTTNKVAAFDVRGLVAANGRVLVPAGIFRGFSDRCLLEYDPARAEPLRLVAVEGQIVNGIAITDLIPVYADYLEDGAVLFVAYAGRFRADQYGGTELMAFFRWKDGHTTVEFTTRQRIGGEQIQFADLRNCAGPYYLFHSLGRLWTTAPGADRPADARLNLQKSNDAYQASWTGPGWLQSSADLVRWQSVLTSPGTLTNDISNPTRFFRIFYP